MPIHMSADWQGASCVVRIDFQKVPMNAINIDLGRLIHLAEYSKLGRDGFAVTMAEAFDPETKKAVERLKRPDQVPHVFCRIEGDLKKAVDALHEKNRDGQIVDTIERIESVIIERTAATRYSVEPFPGSREIEAP